jgi:hypothetical protein
MVRSIRETKSRASGSEEKEIFNQQYLTLCNWINIRSPETLRMLQNHIINITNILGFYIGR